MQRFDVSDDAVLWTSPDGLWVEYDAVEELIDAIESVVNCKSEFHVDEQAYLVQVEAMDRLTRLLDECRPRREE